MKSVLSSLLCLLTNVKKDWCAKENGRQAEREEKRKMELTEIAETMLRENDEERKEERGGESERERK